MDPVSAVGKAQSASERSSALSEVRASLVSSSGGITNLPATWHQAAVVDRLPDGSFSLRTELGQVVARLPEGLALRLGTNVSLRLDPQGGLLLRFAARHAEGSFTLPPPAQEAPAASRAYFSPLPPDLLSMAPPVRTVMIPQATSQESTHSVLSLLPHVGSAAFSLAAALYPQILRTGEMSRLLRQTREPGSMRNASSLLERIEAIASSPSPRLENSNGWLGWQLPYWDGNEIKDMKWFYKEQKEKPEEEMVEEHQAIIELHLSVLGRVQLHCFVSENIWQLRIVTEEPILSAIEKEMLSALAMTASAVGIKAEISFIAGEEKFLPVIHY